MSPVPSDDQLDYMVDYSTSVSALTSFIEDQMEKFQVKTDENKHYVKEMNSKSHDLITETTKQLLAFKDRGGSPHVFSKNADVPEEIIALLRKKIGTCNSVKKQPESEINHYVEVYCEETNEYAVLVNGGRFLLENSEMINSKCALKNLRKYQELCNHFCLGRNMKYFLGNRGDNVYVTYYSKGESRYSEFQTKEEEFINPLLTPQEDDKIKHKS